jgi:hypothetical protein
MNSSFFTSDRATHIKTVVVALLASIVVVLVMTTAQITGFNETRSVTARNSSDGRVVKAPKSTRLSISEETAIR